MRIRVLFLCATNAVQSPIAEALLNAFDSTHFEAFSAGIVPEELHPLTVEVMKEMGIDLQGRVPKSAHEVLDLGFDFVITLSDRARSECPQVAKGELVHWQFEDPLTAPDRTKQKRLFEALRDQMAGRIRLFALVQARSPHVEMDPVIV